jgi:hypothetical protein
MIPVVLEKEIVGQRPEAETRSGRHFASEDISDKGSLGQAVLPMLQELGMIEAVEPAYLLKKKALDRLNLRIAAGRREDDKAGRYAAHVPEKGGAACRGHVFQDVHGRHHVENPVRERKGDAGGPDIVLALDVENVADD